MIIGECPHCNAPTMTEIADRQLPVFSKEKCESCGKEYWLKHSRVNPEAYTEAPKGLTRLKSNSGSGV